MRRKVDGQGNWRRSISARNFKSKINLSQFSFDLRMFMRGGITIGKLIHEENGALFGPAMNEAYLLESKCAIYPRVVISEKAHAHLSIHCAGTTIEPIQKYFDGLRVFDIVSIFLWRAYKPLSLEETESILKDVERDITENEPHALQKIAYLRDQWHTLRASGRLQRASKLPGSDASEGQ